MIGDLGSWTEHSERSRVWGSGQGKWRMRRGEGGGVRGEGEEGREGGERKEGERGEVG